MAQGRRRQSRTEVAVSDSVMAFQHDFLGRGPDRIRTYIVEDLVIVRSYGVLTPAERRLSDDPEGRKTIKAMRRKTLEAGRANLEEAIGRHTGAKVLSIHSDISTRRDELVDIFVLDRIVGEGS